VVTDREGSWVQVSWAGEHVWLRNSNKQPVLVPSKGAVVRVKDGLDLARTYGRAYPEAEAYPEGVTPQAVVPLEYQLKPGQAYVVGDRRVITDYYKATTYDGSAPGDWTDFVGETKYYWVWTGHRQTFVPATDVDISASQ